jgi:hypothetical protein
MMRQQPPSAFTATIEEPIDPFYSTRRECPISTKKRGALRQRRTDYFDTEASRYRSYISSLGDDAGILNTF